MGKAPLEVVNGWRRGPRASLHLRAEVEYALRVRQGLVEPLGPDEAVPGCVCPECLPEAAREPQTGRRLTSDQIQKAKAVSVLDVAEALGLHPEHIGREEWAVLCPMHDDSRPSLRLNEDRGAYCDVCAEGGDPIWFIQAVRRCSFPEAVRCLLTFQARKEGRILVPKRRAA